MDVPPMTGRWVRMEPLEERHREALRAAAADPRIWVNMLLDGSGPEFDRWFDESLANRTADKQVPFVVRRLADEALIGSTSYLDPVLRHRRVEIGSTWYVVSEWGTPVNPECKFLLLAHAFEVFGMNRVSFHTDLHNLHSQAAIAKLGAVREGVLRAHMITRGERIRDTVSFGITAGGWPLVKERLQARLDGY